MAPAVADVEGDAAAAGDGEQPQLPVARPAVHDPEHCGRLGTRQPVGFSHNASAAPAPRTAGRAVPASTPGAGPWSSARQGCRPRPRPRSGGGPGAGSRRTRPATAGGRPGGGCWTGYPYRTAEPPAGRATTASPSRVPSAPPPPGATTPNTKVTGTGRSVTVTNPNRCRGPCPVHRGGSAALTN